MVNGNLTARKLLFYLLALKEKKIKVETSTILDIMADSENFQSCLQTVVDLRSKTANAIKAASDGTHARHGAEMEGKEKKFLSELKLTMDVVNSQIKYDFIFKLNNNVIRFYITK